MATKAPAYEEKIKRAIRDALAYDPLLTQNALIEQLNRRFDHSFDFRYIRRLTDKVMGQAQIEVDRAQLSKRLSALHETHRMARERLLSVLYWTEESSGGLKRPMARDVVEAAKNLVMLDIAVLNAEVANGQYKNLDEAASHLKYPVLPEEQRNHIVSAFEKWGILPPNSLQVIEQSITVHATRVIAGTQ